MSITALGPTMAGGLQPIVEDGYELIYYPDVNNDSLQNEGKPPVFYWLPNYVHIARKDGLTNGDYMFMMMRFAGKQTSEGNIGVTEGESREVAGGVLALTTTAAPPDTVLIQSQKKIIDMFQGKTDFFWGIRSSAPPIFRPVIIMSNYTSISSLSPNPDGSVVVPAEQPAQPAPNPAPAPVPAGGPGGAAGPGGPPNRNVSYPQVKYVTVPVPPMITKKGFKLRDLGKKRDSQGNLDPWYFNMQGQGNGSIDPMGQAAFTGLMGVYPASILYAAFKGAYSPIRVCQALKMKFWLPAMEITIRGNWDRVFTHFSANAKGRYLWFSADVKAEFNNLRISGGIEVDIKVDPTIPGGDKIQEYVDKKTDLISQKFMDLAKAQIFDPPMPQVAAAEASSGGGLFGLWGGGVALKVRRDSTSVDLYYHEKRQMAYLQDTVISSNMEGMYEEIKKDPEAEKKYFITVYMDDWPRKLARIVKPVVNWPKPEINWAGEPVAFLSVQIGYPNTSGELNWVGHTFDRNDNETSVWKVETTQKLATDVNNPPAEWAPDKTYVKRKVHMLEPPDATENPYVRVQIADNEIDIDPGENGSLLNDITVEVRADDAGRIRVGPLSINVQLEDTKQKVEVTLQAIDQDGNDLPTFAPQKFLWNADDQEKPRFWAVFTSDPNVRSSYKYQVRVIVKGSLFTKGMEWTGPWVKSIGNGPLIISVPTMDDEGVVVKKDIEQKHAAIPAPPTKAKGIEVKGQDSFYSVEESNGQSSHMPPTTKTAKKSIKKTDVDDWVIL
jgi:hypothetical protein